MTTEASSIEPSLELPGFVNKLHTIARAASLVAAFTGSFVLVGWALDIEVLKRIVPGLVAMNPATAVGLIGLGLALVLLADERADTLRYRTGRALALSVALLGGLRLLAILNIVDLQVDQLLFRAQLADAMTGSPNRIAPNTAINLMLLGSALFVLDRAFRKLRSPAQILALLAGMASLLALIGYAYGVTWFYGIGSYIPMALHTAVCFVVIAIGVLCLRPTRGIMAVVSSRTSGGVLVRRLLPAVLILPALLGGFRLAGQRAALFDSRFGLWLVVVMTMTVLAVLIGWNAKLLFRSDLERSSAERTLAYQATHDALTQLPNRRFFLERLGAELSRRRGTDRSVAILFLDLDRFKVINDSLGHVVGDELLIAAGNRICAELSEGEMVARLSGDEFTVLLPNSDREHGRQTAQRIARAFGEPFALSVHQVFTTASVGVAVATADDSPDDLIRHADIAMYQAKARGRARYEVFEASMDIAAHQRLRLENELRRALLEGQLVLYYQPEVDIESGRLVGMEALVRWEHPERGLILPSEFIPIAEESGLILDIGRFVLFEACRQAREWQKDYQRAPPLMVSVNLSSKHFQQATLIDEVTKTLEDTGLHPSHLILEITETVAMAGAETTLETLTKLKELGVMLAIDDFGTGFSSLSYLKRFPVDLLKIDKSFVDGVAANGADHAVVEAIVRLGHALGLTVIAEGVETVKQLQELRSLGSELGQGFFFSRPLSDDLRSGMPHLLAGRTSWKQPADT